MITLTLRVCIIPTKWCKRKYFLLNFAHYECWRFLFAYSRMPWNCETPFGYFWEMVFSFTTGQTYIFTNGLIILLFIAMCLHHQAFSDMFGHSLHKLDFEDEIQNDRKLIRELIEFHSMAKRCVWSGSDVFFFKVPKIMKSFRFSFELDDGISRSIQRYYISTIGLPNDLHCLYHFRIGFGSQMSNAFDVMSEEIIVLFFKS